MKKILVVALILTMALGTIAASAQGFVPPGQAKRSMTHEQWLLLMQQRQAQMDEDEEGLYGPFNALPPGLQNKGTPPGLLNNGKTGLPPGLEGRDVLPPGIQMRFMETWQWRNEWGPDKDDVIIHEAATQAELQSLLDDEDVDRILLTAHITLSNTLYVEDGREVWINGGGKTLAANVGFDGWLMRVYDESKLHLINLRLDGYDEPKLDGLVWVEEGSTLTTRNNILRNAEIGFGIEVEEYEEGDEAVYLGRNWFYNVEEPVVFFDEDGDILYPEED